MCRSSTTTLDAGTSAPRVLRDWTSDVIARDYDAAGELRDDAVLVISELVTNAVQAGTRRVAVALTSRTEQLEIAVTDDAPGRPERQQPSTTAGTGRGLLIIAELATEWGISTGARGPFKTVWVHLAVRGATTLSPL